MATTVVLTDAGKEIVQNLVSGVAQAVPEWVAWGTGSTDTASEDDTALETESGDESREQGTLTVETTTTTNDTHQNVATITCASSSKAITEAGTFDASTNGDMFLRATFDAINVDVGDSIEFTWQWQLT